jgi:hypothetical protein
MKRIAVTILVFASSAMSASCLPPTDELKAEFKQYYERNGYPKSWTAARNDLSAADEKKWKPATEKLIAVLEQAKADEADGTSPWRATPYWGDSAENPARDLRESLLRDLIRQPAKPAAVPLVRWYVFQEPVRGYQTGAMQALKPITTPEANALRMEILKTRPENAWVLATALQQAREQKLSVSDEVLTEFARHHRASIRTIAAEWLKAEKKTVPGFDAARALQTDPAKKIVEQLTRLWPDIPAADAIPLSYREEYLRDDGKTVVSSEFVWPMSESKKELKIIDLHGRYQTYDLSTRNTSPKKARETTWRTGPADIEAEVKAIAELRAKGNPDFALSAQGGLTGQFEGNGPSLKELLLGIWLYRANRHELAATLLLPAFDSTDSDDAVVDIARQQLAIVYGQEMLDQFTYRRNYSEALRLALLTEKLYPRTTYSRHARRLARELPLRKDDFQTLSLPTAKEWATLKPTLSREKQIDYLCERLRLLNCFQHGQPGGVNYYDTQFKEPGTHWREDKATAVINPLSELAGDPGDEWQKRPETDGLKLTLDDVPTLAAHLKDDWTMVMVSYWRSFHPSRELHYTRQVIARLIHRLAKQDLCRVNEMARMSPKEIEAHILAIQTWAREHRGRSEADLHVEALEKAIREDERWPWNAEYNANALVELKDRRVIAPTLKFLERKEIDNYDFSLVIRGVAPFDPAAFRTHALKMLEFRDTHDQLWGACLLIAADEPKIAFDKIEALVSPTESSGVWNWRYALEVLLAAKNNRAKSLIAKIVSSKRLLEPPGEHSSWKLRQDFVPKLYNGGYREEILKFYDVLLDDNTPGLFGADKEFRKNHGYAAEVLEFLRDSDETLRTLADKPGEPREKIPALKKWIATRLAEQKK